MYQLKYTQIYTYVYIVHTCVTCMLVHAAAGQNGRRISPQKKWMPNTTADMLNNPLLTHRAPPSRVACSHWLRDVT